MAQSSSTLSITTTATPSVITSIPTGCSTDDNSVFFGLTSVLTSNVKPTQLIAPHSNGVGFKIIQGKIYNRSGKQGYIDTNGKLRFDEVPFPLRPIYTGLFATCSNSSLTLGTIGYWLDCGGGFTDRYVPGVGNQPGCNPVWLQKMQIPQSADDTGSDITTTALASSTSPVPTPSSPSATSSDTPHGFNGTIAGILAGGIVIFVTFLATALYVFRRRRMKQRVIIRQFGPAEMADQPRRELDVPRPVRHLNRTHPMELYGSEVQKLISGAPSTTINDK